MAARRSPAPARSGLMTMSRRDVDSLYDSMRDAQSYIQSRRDGGGGEKNVTGKIVEALEVGAGATAVGVLAGRLQTTSIGSSGVPLGLALGFAGHLAAFFDIAGKYSDHVHNVSNGALAGWLAMWGAGQGKQLREKAGLATGPITAGAPPQPIPGTPYALPPFVGAQPPQPIPGTSYAYPPFGGVGAQPSGYLPAPGVRRGPLTEAELAALAARRR